MTGRTFDQAGVAFDEAGLTFDDLGSAELSPRLLWVVIYSTPPVYLYGSPDVLGELPAGQRRARLLVSVGEIQADIEGESPNLPIVLANRAGQAARLFARPPLGMVAEVHNVDGLLFAGVVGEITLGATGQLRIEA